MKKNCKKKMIIYIFSIIVIKSRVFIIHTAIHSMENYYLFYLLKFVHTHTHTGLTRGIMCVYIFFNRSQTKK